MKELPDKEVLIKIKNGQIDFFALVVKKYTQQIFQYVRSRLFEKEDADDLVQEIFIQLYKAIPRFDVQRPILPYLYQITKNELKMYYRSKKTVAPLHENSAVDERDVYEMIDMLDSEPLLKSLSSDQQKALQLLVEGYSYEDISRKLGKPLNTVRTIIRRARLHLIKNKKQ